MRTPPFILFVALLFWGWFAGAILFAAAMGVALEMSRVVKTRWSFSAREYNRIWDLCGLLFLGAALYCFATRDSENVVVTLLHSLDPLGRVKEARYTDNVSLLFFQWWPMIFFPFALAQAYGERDKHPASTFFYFMRRRERLAGVEPSGGFNVSYIYFAICLFGASATEHRFGWFYVGFAAVAVCGLWTLRPKRFSPALFGALVLAAAWIGYRGHLKLHRLQGQVESGIMQWVTQWANRNIDPNKSYTRMGRIGEMKLSGRIVLRVKQGRGAMPLLLRDSSYSIFHREHWNAGRGREFSSALPEADTTTWTVGDRQSRTNSLRVSMYLKRGKGILPLPSGTWQLADLFVGELNRNNYGVVQVLEGPGMVEYEARHGEIAVPDLRPLEDANGGLEDLMVPEEERPAIDRIAQLLRLDSRPTMQEKLVTIVDFFSRDFEYSLYQDVSVAQMPDGVTPLSYFLETSKKGHCEFYGSAATLLLRRAGIPARYANGYAVHEAVDEEEGEYVVRERDGHAWAIFWDEASQRWMDFDMTPASWQEMEDEEYSSAFEPVSDFFRKMQFGFSSWWWSSREGRFQQYLAGAVVLLVAFLFWRLLKGRKRGKKEGDDTTALQAVVWPGMDSAFYEIEQRLEAVGLERRKGETLGVWLQRLKEAATPFDLDALAGILNLHYRYRFDPVGMSEEELEAFRSRTEAWLDGSARGDVQS